MADYRALAKEGTVGQCVIRDATFLDVNDRFAALTGFDADALVGRDVTDVFERLDGCSGDSDGDVRAVFDGKRSVADLSPDIEFDCRLTIRRRDQPPLDATVRFTRITSADDPALLGAVVPSTSTRAGTSVLEQATADLVRATTRRDVYRVGVEAAAVLGFEAIGVYSLDEGGELTVVETMDTAPPLPSVLAPTGNVWDALFASDLRVLSGEEIGLAPSTDLFVVPLSDTDLLVAVSRRADESETMAELLDLLSTNVEAALDRVDREQRLERLHEATRELMVAETDSEIASVAVETARDVLHHDLCGVHLYDAERDSLLPVAVSERTRAFLGTDGEIQPLTRGGSLAFEAFEAGETRVYDHVNEAEGVMDPDTELRSELIVPLGDRGVFLVGSVLPGYFDETDISLVKVLCANVEAALERAERETAFREQRKELEERNDRLDEFASMISHDLRNPLNVAQGRLELARERCTCDAGDHLDIVAESHDQMAELIDDLLTLARQGRHLGETEPVDLGTLARTCWQAFDAGTLTVVDDLTVEADRSRLRELLENLLRNSVEHGSTSSRPATDDSVEHGSTGSQSEDVSGLTVRIGALGSPDDPRGFYVEDDGPGIPEADRDAVFEHGYSTDPDGTGFGLAIVRAVADAHGWDVTVTDSERGGARFEFLL